LFGFIEFGASALLAVTAPSELRNSSLNTLLAVIILFQGIVQLPLTYSLILGQEQAIYQQKGFQERWGSFLFGVRVIENPKNPDTKSNATW